jgi:hypothetical protein
MRYRVECSVRFVRVVLNNALTYPISSELLYFRVD